MLGVEAGEGVVAPFQDALGVLKAEGVLHFVADGGVKIEHGSAGYRRAIVASA